MRGNTSIVILFAALALSGAESPAQQHGEEFRNLRPIRTIRNVRPVVDSSYRWFPQVQEAYNFGGPSPSNPKQIVPPMIWENSLPVGEAGQTTRGTLLGRFPGIDATGWFPPDPNIAVGPNHVVEVVNSSVAWFDKATGVKQFQVSMGPVAGPAEGFFESVGATDFVFDPKCFYDPVSNRFFVLALELEGGAQLSKALIAVSDDNNPNGTWRKYRFEARLDSGGASWLDYPGFGCNKDAVVVTGNQFGFSSGFKGTQVIVIPKAPLLVGGAATQSQILMGSSVSVQVARSRDASLDKVYLIGQASNTANLAVYAVTGLPSTPAVSSKLVPIPTWYFPTSPAVSTNGHSLDSLDGRIVDADWRGGRIAAVHTVRLNQSDTRNVIRWYELNTNNWPTSGTDPTFRQAGNVAGGNGEHYNMGGIGVNGAGDIAVTFTRSSANIVADHMVAGRAASDPLGTMGQPILVQTSFGSQYGGPSTNRWGDYFSVEVDPVDDLSFWSVGMVARSDGDWTTVINKHLISTILPGQSVDVAPASAAIYVDPVSVPQQQGTNLLGGLGDVAASDNSFLTIDTVGASGIGQIAAGEFVFNTNFAGTVQTLKVRVEANGLLNKTGMVWVWDRVLNRYRQMRSFPLHPTSNTVWEASLPAPFTRWISPTGEIRVVVRGHAPILRNSNQGPTPFRFMLDMVNVRAKVL
jgi:hypothetical protein